MLLKAPNVVIRDLTITGESSGGVLASGGAPVVENVHFMSVGLPYQGGSSCSSPCNSLEFLDGAIGVVRDSDFTGGGEIGVDGGASAVIEANRLSGGPHIALFEVGEGTVVRGNAITGTVARGIGTFGDTTPLIEGNQLSAPGPVGIDLWDGSPIVRDNVITEAVTGINVKRETGSVALLANDLTQNGSGITWWGGTDGVIDGNTISEGISGLVINGGSPTVTGNSVCGNTSNLTVSSTADLVDDGTNDICEDAPPQ